MKRILCDCSAWFAPSKQMSARDSEELQALSGSAALPQRDGLELGAFSCLVFVSLGVKSGVLTVR